MKRKHDDTEIVQHFLNLQNIMSVKDKTNKPFIDLMERKELLSIAKIKTIFDSYEKFEDHRIYGQSIVWYDVGAMLFLIYIVQKYPESVELCFDVNDILLSFQKGDREHLEWVKHVDQNIDENESPKFHIYVKDGVFYFDKNIIQRKTYKIQILMVSHSFTGHSGHMGCVFIFNKKAYYYDSNGMKDKDEKDYYDKFNDKIKEIFASYEIEYCPYVWKRGIQEIQNCEECKYNLNITGMCCSWSYLMIELKLMNPGLTVEEIENKIKKKYRNRLTRYVVSYQQRLHPILLDLSKTIFDQFQKMEIKTY
jgi:hypothetical protein